MSKNNIEYIVSVLHSCKTREQLSIAYNWGLATILRVSNNSEIEEMQTRMSAEYGNCFAQLYY